MLRTLVGQTTRKRRESVMTPRFGDVSPPSDESPESPHSPHKHHHWYNIVKHEDEDEEQDWWFASTAIPLLAATVGPLANVLSIGALVTSWRMSLVPPNGGPLLSDLEGLPFPDPHWCYWLNVVSLILGSFGNLLLLFNFTNRIRYIIALPLTILCWYLAPGFLIGITVAMHVYVPPQAPFEIYTQGYWYAVMAACLYFCCSMSLMVNMLGYFLGHYPSKFNLTENQRTLITQTMMFFFWLAGGGAVFARIETLYGVDGSWQFVDGLYFCDVTILTVGFGDLYPTDDIGRGLVFPYSVGGIIMLGLVISSINRFARELGHEKVVAKHAESMRLRTYGRTVTSSMELEERTGIPVDVHKHESNAQTERQDSDSGSAPRRSSSLARRRSSVVPALDAKTRIRALRYADEEARKEHHRLHLHVPHWHRHSENKQSSFGAPMQRYDTQASTATTASNALQRVGTAALSRVTAAVPRKPRQPKVILLREEKDRFDAMRSIQRSTRLWQRYLALTISFFSFSILWCIGAMCFYFAERDVQGMTYFQALYFCYVSLLTIGYGDLAPKSNVGRPFFVVWSLVAVPTMTVLISHMGDTLIASYQQLTVKLADFTVLPQKGIWRGFLDRHQKVLTYLQDRKARKAAERRLAEGFQIEDDETGDGDVDLEVADGARDLTSARMDHLAKRLRPMDEHQLAKRLAIAIKRTAHDLRGETDIHYTYEEWAEFTHLIRFSSAKARGESDEAMEEEEDEDGLIEWDWIGEDSPMMTGQTEPEFLLDRLTESMTRYIRRQAPSRPDRVPSQAPGISFSAPSTFEKNSVDGGREPSMSEGTDYGSSEVPTFRTIGWKLDEPEGPAAERRAAAAAAAADPKSRPDPHGIDTIEEVDEKEGGLPETPPSS